MNDETIIIHGIILLGVGAIIGALTYHLIVYRFSNKIEKQLDKSIKNYENFVLKKATNTIDRFESITNEVTNISNNIKKEQKSIYQSTCSISEDIDTFFRELKSSQEMRVSLENEIIKLKNIINRKNKQNKEK